MTKAYRNKVGTERCYFCPKRTDIEVHHIVPQRFDGTDGRENLVAVCDRCHKKLERLYDKRFYDQLGIDDESGERESHFGCYYNECELQADFKCDYGGGVGYYCTEHTAERDLERDVFRVLSPVSDATQDELDEAKRNLSPEDSGRFRSYGEGD